MTLENIFSFVDNIFFPLKSTKRNKDTLTSTNNKTNILPDASFLISRTNSMCRSGNENRFKIYRRIICRAFRSQSVSMPPLFRIQRIRKLRKPMCTRIQVPSFTPVFLVFLNIPEPLLPLERGSERSNKSLCFPRY